MYKVLRIIFCILAVAAAAAAVFIFVFFGMVWGFVTVGACVLFAVGMFLCRNAQIREELRRNPPEPRGDFITGKVKEDKKDE